MKVIYKLRCDTVIDEDGCSYTVYGIAALNTFGEILVIFDDIFFDKQKALDFINLCNTEGLELIHLNDVIEDLLS